MKKRTKGDKWKPDAVVLKDKGGVPTRIIVNGFTYCLEPTELNHSRAKEQRSKWNK